MRWIIVWLVMAGAVSADPAALSAVNTAREAAGRAPLVYSDTLEAVARAHGDDMVLNGFFSHAGSNGSDIADRLSRAGFSFCFAAENIARGQIDVAQVMVGWMESRGHKRNILHKKARAVGLARTGDNTWVMVLAAAC